MAKKQTVGGPRPRRVTEEDLQRRREYKSRAERERMWQRRVIVVIAVLVTVSVAILLFGLITDTVIVPRQAITSVNGDEITTGDFQDRVRFIRWQTGQQIRELYGLVGGDVNTLQQYAGNQISQLRSPVLMGSSVLEEMEEELLLKQAAEERGITVDDAAVQQQVDDYMASTVGLTLPEDETSTPTNVPSETPTPLVSPTPTNTPLPTATVTPTSTSTVDPAATAEATAEVAATESATEPATEPADESATAAATEPAAESTAEATTEATSDADATEATEAPTATASPTLDANQMQATLDKAANSYYDDAEDGADIDRDVVHDVFYYQALRLAMVDSLGAEVPTEELQSNVRHMLFAFNPANPSDPTPPGEEQKTAAKARADEAMAALQAGEPFADLAKALSNDTGTASEGGLLGWTSPDAGTLDPAFADAVKSAEVGAIVGPIESQFGYHIIQVMGREVRTLTDSELGTRRQQQYENWLTEQKTVAKIERRDDWTDRIPDEPTYNELLGDILPIQ